MMLSSMKDGGGGHGSGKMAHSQKAQRRSLKAAAATAVLMALAAGIAPPEPEPVVFRADRPFLHFLIDTHSGAILFAGRVANPLEK